MNKFSKTILIISIAVISVSALGVSVAQAQTGLEVEFETGNNPVGNPYPLFIEAGFTPGDSVTRWVKVTNNSGTTQSIATEAINYPEFPNIANVPANDLSRALEIVIREKNGSDLYGSSGKTLFSFYEHGETYLSDVNNGETQEYEFEVSFPLEKGDYWQNATTNFDIMIGSCQDCGNGNGETPTVYACNDGIDNDNDGLIDMDDPGCASPTDNDESDNGNGEPPTVYACNDGIDNDNDGLIDMDDPGCDSPTDDDESDNGNGNGNGDNGNGGTAGGGGAVLPLGLIIQYENARTGATTATITWLTSYKSTSRVIYDTEPNQFDLSKGEPSYGYEFYTDEYDTPASTNGVTGHSISITGLDPLTTYYFRCVSHASPDTVGTEHSFTTLAMGGIVVDGDDGDTGDGDSDGDGEEGDGEEGDTGDGDSDGDGEEGNGEGDTGDTGAGAGDDGTGDAGEAGDEWEDDFEYGDHIWEHQDNDLDLSGDDPSSAKATAGEAKFLASIAAFFGDLEGWRLVLFFLLFIILALIILRLIKAYIDSKKTE